MSSSPADVASAMISTSIVDGSTGWPLKIGHIPSSPDQVVVFTDTGGMNPNPAWRLDYPTFQALVRGAKGEYGVAYDKARAVRDALLGIDSVTIGSDRWVSITCLGDIGMAGYDENERPMLSVNFRAIIEPADGANREDLP